MLLGVARLVAPTTVGKTTPTTAPCPPVGPDADLANCNLSNTNLIGADLSGANLKNTDLQYANLSGANLSHAQFTGTFFSGANFTGATVTDARFNPVMGGRSGEPDFGDGPGCELHQRRPARLHDHRQSGRGQFHRCQPGRDAGQSRPSFSEANLSGANFTGTNLAGSRSS